jgi:hypothetical protein
MVTIRTKFDRHQRNSMTVTVDNPLSGASCALRVYQDLTKFRIPTDASSAAAVSTVAAHQQAKP